MSEVLRHDNLVKVALMREPVSWMYSWYRFYSRIELRYSSHSKHFKSIKNVTFEEFIEGYLEDDPLGYSIIGSTQFEFLTSNSGIVEVDELFFYEKTNKLVDYMPNKTG